MSQHDVIIAGGEISGMSLAHYCTGIAIEDCVSRSLQESRRLGR